MRLVPIRLCLLSIFTLILMAPALVQAQESTSAAADKAEGELRQAIRLYDDALRRAANDSGASRVFAYRALFEHGDRELGAWIAALAGPEEGA